MFRLGEVNTAAKGTFFRDIVRGEPVGVAHRVLIGNPLKSR